MIMVILMVQILIMMTGNDDLIRILVHAYIYIYIYISAAISGFPTINAQCDSRKQMLTCRPPQRNQIHIQAQTQLNLFFVYKL